MKLGNIVLIALGGVVVYLWAKNRKAIMTTAVTPSNEVTPPNEGTPPKKVKTPMEPWWRSGKYKEEQVIQYVFTRLPKNQALVSFAPGTPASVINENYLTMGVNSGILVPSTQSEKAFIVWLKLQNMVNRNGINRLTSPAFSENRDLIISADSNTPLIVNTSTGQSAVSSGLRPATML
jgi:hypothetical protein